jgi:hypothetical protein
MKKNSRIWIQDPDPDPLVRGPDPHQNVMDLEHWSDHSSNSSEASHTVPWVSFIWIRIWIANPDLGESISNAKSKYVLYLKLLGLF